MFKFRTPTLVVRKFDINEDGPDGIYLEIAGRPPGLISWVLTLMKLDTLTILKLEKDNLSVKSSDLSGEVHTVMPLGAIESTQCGFSKPIMWLTIGIIIMIGGLFSGSGGAFFGSLVLGAIFVTIYYFSKRMFISVSAGSKSVDIAYKESVIEGVSVNLERTLAAIRLLNDKISSEHTK